MILLENSLKYGAACDLLNDRHITNTFDAKDLINCVKNDRSMQSNPYLKIRKILIFCEYS